MQFVSPALLIVAIALATVPLRAEDRPPNAPPSGDATTAPSGATLTGKERLAGKWMDEQRVDNCKVPPDKRGPAPRPDCSEQPAR